MYTHMRLLYVTAAVLPNNSFLTRLILGRILPTIALTYYPPLDHLYLAQTYTHNNSTNTIKEQRSILSLLEARLIESQFTNIYNYYRLDYRSHRGRPSSYRSRPSSYRSRLSSHRSRLSSHRSRPTVIVA